ncbi:hypothetical protein [Thiofilum flexile]|uniref:hypothetical protein n=1 Tax=Thiofilum flexile TaxID=125627 RepID=UPI00037BF949|nr:hypothetical protein [Thiofilum flexile]
MKLKITILSLLWLGSTIAYADSTSNTLNPSPLASTSKQPIRQQMPLAIMRAQVAGLISAMPLKTERLKQAAKYFNENKDDMAQAALDSAVIIQEQEQLLKLPDSASRQMQLNSITDELILLAHLIELDSKLEDERFPKANQYFKQAIQYNRNSGYLDQYAQFLQRNNQFQQAEAISTEAIENQRKKITSQSSNPEDLFSLVILLNHLAGTKEDLKKYDEAYLIYKEALNTTKQLIALDPAYFSRLAFVFDSLSQLLVVDNSYKTNVEKDYRKIIDSIHLLAKDKPKEYLPILSKLESDLAFIKNGR